MTNTQIFICNFYRILIAYNARIIVYEKLFLYPNIVKSYG